MMYDIQSHGVRFKAGLAFPRAGQGEHSKVLEPTFNKEKYFENKVLTQGTQMHNHNYYIYTSIHSNQ